MWNGKIENKYKNKIYQKNDYGFQTRVKAKIFFFFTINELIKRDKNHNIILCEATKSNRFGFDNNQLHGDFRQEQERGNSSI